MSCPLPLKRQTQRRFPEGDHDTTAQSLAYFPGTEAHMMTLPSASVATSVAAPLPATGPS